MGRAVASQPPEPEGHTARHTVPGAFEFAAAIRVAAALIFLTTPSSTVLSRPTESLKFKLQATLPDRKGALRVGKARHSRAKGT